MSLPTDNLLHVVWGDDEFSSDSESEEHGQCAAMKRAELQRKYGITFRSEEPDMSEHEVLAPGPPPGLSTFRQDFAGLSPSLIGPPPGLPAPPSGVMGPSLGLLGSLEKTMTPSEEEEQQEEEAVRKDDKDVKNDKSFAEKRATIRKGFSSTTSTATTCASEADINDGRHCPVTETAIRINFSNADTKKKMRLCKEKRERYKKITAKLTNQILADPDSFDADTLHLPVSMPESVSAQLISTMKALQEDVRSWRLVDGHYTQQEVQPQALAKALTPGPVLRDTMAPLLAGP